MKTNLKRIFNVLGSLALILVLSLGLCLAEETSTDGLDLLGALDKLKTLVFTLISGIGGILTVFGVFQFGSSFPAHDPSQRSQGLMCIAGGLIIAAAPWIVNYLTN